MSFFAQEFEVALSMPITLAANLHSAYFTLFLADHEVVYISGRASHQNPTSAPQSDHLSNSEVAQEMGSYCSIPCGHYKPGGELARDTRESVPAAAGRREATETGSRRMHPRGRRQEYGVPEVSQRFESSCVFFRSSRGNIPRAETEVCLDRASDRLEGRGPGSRGEFLATEYLAAEFKKASLKPIGERGTYFQPVPLLRVVTSPKATLWAVKGETTLNIPCEEGFSGTSQTQMELEEFDAEAVFVGHCITAPEFGWDDYRDVDVKGKVVVRFTNEPLSDDPKFFGGKALTYYDGWTFKFEEAARRGAKACFIIHANQTAGYPYSVVPPLDGAQLKRESGRRRWPSPAGSPARRARNFWA
jgi:hypothetical protein